MQKWQHYLKNGKFVIQTDHESLKHLLSQRLTHHLQHKSLCKLLGLDYEIQYKKGMDTKVADALSRRAIMGKAEFNAIQTRIPTWAEDLANSYEGDLFVQELLREFKDNPEARPPFSLSGGILRYKHRFYIGSNGQWRDKVLPEMNNSAIGGHSGILGTYKRTRQVFHWPGMKKSVHEHVLLMCAK